MSLREDLTKKIVCVFIFTCGTLLAAGSQNYSRQEVEKVLKAIEMVERDTARGIQRPLKKISISEEELNAYIAYRIEEESQEYLKEIRVKLFKKNKIEGMILIDLRKEKVPQFLRPQMTLYFGGKLEVKDGLVRLIWEDLFLEEQRIEPQLLDFIIAFTAKIGNYEVWSISDWWEMPHGIKDFETQRGKATFFY